jgi:hypothetical protein
MKNTFTYLFILCFFLQSSCSPDAAIDPCLDGYNNDIDTIHSQYMSDYLRCFISSNSLRIAPGSISDCVQEAVVTLHSNMAFAAIAYDDCLNS